ncbi:NAD-dependent epimerase/dehydratase family protein [Lacibacter sediminis]|uniref:NAD-dependent epimerase/dehydratase family protein n=1 Tax=Lacibacter sediminis TaxID=2760713 RepID=A0A7G5XHP7_9BACT|nr:NAD-dependent epimerase/dehydratase family protein [Lacibacter sediminis]QNA45000.1 NAD-dependent epimerase/dehydratase family protein [Lacibacter sediminis]
MHCILITGGCGFAGSNLALYFKAAYPEARIIAFDNLKRRGSELSLARLKAAGIEFIHGDIRNKEDFEEVGKVNFIIEAAAEPSVLAGIDGTPDYVVNTNLLGTINCLNYAVKQKAGIIFLSTSRVYPFGLLDEAAYTESDTRFHFSDQQTIKGVSSKGITTEFPLHGARSLYGATKLASELLITEYVEFLGLNAVINRCGVLTGPWQMGKVDQGVIVLWMARHFWKRNLTYNGYGGMGKQVRDMLHIHDLFRLIDWQMQHIDAVNGQINNVGGGIDCSVSLKELTAICEDLTGNSITITPVPENRKADVRLYVTDNTGIMDSTSWQPLYTPEKIMQEIYVWIRDHEEQLKPILY